MGKESNGEVEGGQMGKGQMEGKGKGAEKTITPPFLSHFKHCSRE